MLQITFGLHHQQHAFAHHDQLRRLAGISFRDIDHELLKGLVRHAVDLLEQNLWLADLHLVALASHRLNQDAQMQNSSSVDVPFVLAVGRFYPKGKVFLKFCIQALTDVAAGQEVSVFAQERGGVDGEEETHCGFIHGDAFNGIGLLQVGNGVANLKSIHSSDRAEVTAAHVVHFFFAQP